MKVLYFSYAYPNVSQPTLGTFNRSLLAAMSDQHQVRVLAPVPIPQVLRSRWRGQNALSRDFSAIPNVVADYVPFFYPPKILRERFDEFLWWSVRRHLENAIREFEPDVILSYWAHPDGAVAVRAGQLHRIPVATMVGGSDVLLLARAGRRREVILRTLQQADAVVAVSQHIADTLLSDGLPAEKLQVVHRGIDRQIFHPGDRIEARRERKLPLDTFTFVSVGRLETVKGHTHLVEACRSLFRSGLRFNGHILGGGPWDNQLRAQIAAGGLEHVIKLHGSQPQAELAKWYRAADVTVLPSLSEGIPNVLLESMACGTRWIASDVGGIPEIFDPGLDVLVPPADPAALATALHNQSLKVQADSQPKRRFEPGTWHESAAKLCEVLQSLGETPTRRAIAWQECVNV